MKLLYKTAAAALVFSLVIGGISASADDVSDLQQQQSSVEDQANKAQDYLNNTQIQKSDLMTQVAELDAQLDDVTNELDSIGAELDTTNAELSTAEDDLAAADEKRAAQYDALKERIRYMQENGMVGYLDVLFQATSFSDFINRIEYVGAIIDYDNNLVKNLQATEDLISQKTDEIAIHKSDIESLQNSQLVKQQQLEDSILQKNNLIYSLTEDEVKYQQQIKDLEDTDRQLQQQIKAAQDAAAQAAAEKAAAVQSAATQAEKDAASQAAQQAASRATYSGGAFAWPVPGYTDISSGFGSRTSPITGQPEFHTGIDIPAPQGTDIHAAADGTVILSGYNGGYGYCVVIDHGSGLSTLYGHNSKLLVNVGDVVKKGDVISKCGSTGYATGPHCHFEVRLNGTAVSPFDYLQ